MEPVRDPLGDQGGVAAGAVVDDEVDLSPVLYSLIYDFCRFLDCLQIYAGDDFLWRWITSPMRPLLPIDLFWNFRETFANCNLSQLQPFIQ